MKRILISLIALLYSTNAYADNVSNLMGLGMPGALAAQIDAQYGSAVSASIVPGADATYDLGTSALSWRSAYLDTSLINTGSAFEIKASTADAADSATLAIAGGGDNLETRGSHIFVSGNESASTGALSLNGGNIATSHISTSINHASALIRFFNASGSKVWDIDNNGQLKSTTAVTNDIGWTVQSGANTACNTTCGTGCVVGFDSGSSNIAVSCATATADVCLCAGAS